MAKALMPVQFAAELKRRASRLESALIQAERVSLDEANRTAGKLSQGPYKSRTLAKMGHPYRHGGNPPMHPGVINEQEGTFAKDWHMDSPTRSGNRITMRLRNTAPQAGYLDKGTSKMIARPIRELIFRSVRRRRVARLKQVLIDVLGARPK